MKTADLFRSLDISITESPPSFKKWLMERFPHWKFIDEFCQALPAEWTLIMVGDYDMCYVSDPETIYNTCLRLDSSPAFKAANLLPIGALMDGGMLLVDTQDSNEMAVGKLRFSHFVDAPDDKISPEGFHRFDMSYENWLGHIVSNPSNSQYL